MSASPDTAAPPAGETVSGGTGSGASTILTDFSGTGTLTVVPEPATVRIMLLSGLLLLVGFYRSSIRNA